MMIEIVPNWHPVWVHFPIALLVMATVFYLLALVMSGSAAERVTSAGRWNLVAGTVLVIPTLITGYLAYNSVAHDAAGHQAMQRHMTAALITAGLFVVTVILAWLDRFRARGAGIMLIVALLLGTGAVAVTGYLGAENVYRHGLGVERLPRGVQGEEGASPADATGESNGSETGGSESTGPEQDSGQGGTGETVPEGHGGHDHAH